MTEKQWDRASGRANTIGAVVGIVALIAAPALTYATFRALTEHRLAALEIADSKQSDKIDQIGDTLARVETKVDDLRERR